MRAPCCTTLGLWQMGTISESFLFPTSSPLRSLSKYLMNSDSSPHRRQTDNAGGLACLSFPSQTQPEHKALSAGPLLSPHKPSTPPAARCWEGRWRTSSPARPKHAFARQCFLKHSQHATTTLGSWHLQVPLSRMLFTNIFTSATSLHLCLCSNVSLLKVGASLIGFWPIPRQCLPLRHPLLPNTLPCFYVVCLAPRERKQHRLCLLQKSAHNHPQDTASTG